MKLCRIMLGIGLLAALSGAAAPAIASDGLPPLRVCLDQENPPFSFKTVSSQGGYDLSVAEAVANRLGRKLEVQWVDADHSDESRPDLETNALLSAGKCELAGGYALVAQQLGPPIASSWFLPRYEGGRGGPRGPRVTLGVLKPSRPYHATGLVLALGAAVPDRKVETLKDVQGLRLAASVLSLADRVLMSYRNGILAAAVTHLGPNENLLAKLGAGEDRKSVV